MRALALALMIAFGSVGVSTAQDSTSVVKLLDDGEAAYRARAFDQAAELFQQAAEQGSARAQERLGDLYQSGSGRIPQDLPQALAWYLKAAEQGDTRAQMNLHTFYSNGWGTTQDFGKALAWARKAADQGDVDALEWVGIHYLNGTGVPADIEQARFWFRKAIAEAAKSEDPRGTFGQAYLCGTYEATWLKAAAGKDLSEMDRVIGTIDHDCSLMLRQTKSWRAQLASGRAPRFDAQSWLEGRGAAIACGVTAPPKRPKVADEAVAKKIFLTVEAATWPGRDLKQFPQLYVFDASDHWIVFRASTFVPPRSFYHLVVSAGPDQLSLDIDKCDGATSISSHPFGMING